MKPIDGKPLIFYPCQWTFKVIGWDETDVLAAIKEVIEPAEYQVAPSKKSRHGRYISLSLTLNVVSEEARNGIYHNLAAHRHVKIVI